MSSSCTPECRKEKAIDELETHCDLVLSKLPKINADMESLEDKISTYTKAALSLVGLLCAIATYGFFEVNDFRKEYHTNNEKTKENIASVRVEIASVKEEIKDELGLLRDKMYDRDEAIVKSISAVQKEMAKVATILEIKKAETLYNHNRSDQNYNYKSNVR